MIYDDCLTPILLGMNVKGVRELIKAERKRRRWTLDRLASESGITRSAIHDIEQGRTKDPKLDTIARLIEAMGMSLTQFFAQIERQTKPDLHDEYRAAKVQHGTSAEVVAASTLKQFCTNLAHYLLSIQADLDATTRQVPAARVDTPARRRRG
jgi:transcriptional regulator with XRE-family HTH domain